MGFLKGFALGIIGFLLFVSLLALGTGMTFNLTALNPGFVNGQIQKLDVGGVLHSVLADSTEFQESRALRDFIDTNLPNHADAMKIAVSGAIDRFYDYILGRTDTLDLQVVVGETVLAPELLYAILDDIDWAQLADERIQDEISASGGVDPTFSYLLDYVDDAMVKLDSWFKATVREVVPPIHAYLLGQSSTLDVSISLAEPALVLYETLLDVYTRFPPPEFSGLTPAQRLAEFNRFFLFQLAPNLPLAIDIDSSVLSGTPEQLNEAFTFLETEAEGLKQDLRVYWFAFYSLLAFILLLLGLSFLIVRRLSKFLLFAGVVFFAFGLLGFVSVMVTNSVINPGTDFGEMPAALQVWLPQVIENALRPFLFFSISAGIIGIGGIIGWVLTHPHQPRPLRPANLKSYLPD